MAYPGEFSRLALLYKWITVIPHEVILVLSGLYLSLAYFVAFWVILVTGRYPRRMFESVKRALGYEFKVLAYFPMSLSDKWSGDDVYLDVDYPERLSRLGLLLKLPGSIIVWPSYLGTSVVLVLLSFASWWAILLTGRHPKRLFDLNVALLQWMARVSTWQWNLRDDWSLIRATKGVGVAVGVGTFVVVSLFTLVIVLAAITQFRDVREVKAVVEDFMMAGLTADVEVALALTGRDRAIRGQLEDLFCQAHLFDSFLSIRA